MSDSKTAKKIQVVPCQVSAGYAHVEVDGFTLKNGKDDQYPGETWCKPQAEAQAKAAELRGECSDCGSDEPAKTLQILSPFPGSDIPIDRDCDNKFHAAAQPTETRPPGPASAPRCEFCNTYCFTGMMAIPCKQRKEFWAARAAAPVEPPKCGKYLGDWRNLNVRCQLPKHHEGNCSCEPPATELVEPAPRPQMYFDCPTCKVSFEVMSDGTGHRIGFRRLNDCAVASSPVARPQPAMCIHGLVKGVHCAEPAARVEQPTPQPFYCHCCGKIATCPECELKHAPAAPVVEQRRPNPYIPKVALIEECMKIVENVWRENTGRDMETIAFQIAHNALGEFRNETAAKRNGWAASQRTEGEGTNG